MALRHAELEDDDYRVRVDALLKWGTRLMATLILPVALSVGGCIVNREYQRGLKREAEVDRRIDENTRRGHELSSRLHRLEALQERNPEDMKALNDRFEKFLDRLEGRDGGRRR